MWKREMPFGNLYQTTQGTYKEMRTPSGSMFVTPSGKIETSYNVPGSQFGGKCYDGSK